MTVIERIEDEIWQLENSYGWGAYHDGLVTARIAELQAQLGKLRKVENQPSPYTEKGRG